MNRRITKMPLMVESVGLVILLAMVAWVIRAAMPAQVSPNPSPAASATTSSQAQASAVPTEISPSAGPSATSSSTNTPQLQPAEATSVAVCDEAYRSDLTALPAPKRVPFETEYAGCVAAAQKTWPPVVHTPRPPTIPTPAKLTPADDPWGMRLAGAGAIEEEGSNAPLPPAYHMVNGWYEDTPGRSLAVYGGKLFNNPDDHNQGSQAIVVVLDNSHENDYMIPAATGAVRIVDAQGEQLALVDEAGKPFFFDVATRTFVAPNAPAPYQRPVGGGYLVEGPQTALTVAGYDFENEWYQDVGGQRLVVLAGSMRSQKKWGVVVVAKVSPKAPYRVLEAQAYWTPFAYGPVHIFDVAGERLTLGQNGGPNKFVFDLAQHHYVDWQAYQDSHATPVPSPAPVAVAVTVAGLVSTPAQSLNATTSPALDVTATPPATPAPTDTPLPPPTATVVPFATATALPPATAIPSASRLSVSPAQQAVQAGQTFTVALQLNADRPTRAVQVAASFTPAVIHCDTVSEGDLFQGWAASHGGGRLYFPAPTFDNVAGQMSDLGLALIPTETVPVNATPGPDYYPPDATFTRLGGVRGLGTLVTLHCTALAAGVSPITVSGVKLYNDYSNPGRLEVALDNGQVFVGVTPTPTP